MINQYMTDTISAIATPIGNGGVSIVRISGEKSFEIIHKIFSSQNLIAGKIYHGWIIENGEKLDEVIVLPFKAPNSYTGEDVIEIQCHGGVHITNKILDLTIKNGARYAEKGEYTKRAFLNRKMDLSQAEAVLDLIHARSEKFASASAKNLFGKLSIEVANIRKEIMDLLSRIIAAVDFPEDVVEPEYSYIEDTIEEIIEKINYILSFSKSSNVFRQGIKIVLAGRPNVGKSSLFNTLLNLDRAIVTDIAGTTRDVIQETLDIDGIAVTIIDTAGIRDDENINKVEAIGIDYSKKYVQDADLVLFLYDLNDGFTKEDKEIIDSIKDKKYIKVATKSDLTSFKDDDSICISLKTGENIEILKQKIKSAVITQNLTEVEFITNQRQQKALEETKNSLINALIAAQNNEIQDLISIDIKSALMYISEVSGEVITDDILNNIFDNFCIGK
ncbi:TPA: tRNA uridine-5-carboxymethylaminomethyl(34) synthesis GTPase MnmE [Candidatus Avigastranaerophilus faecigallinarum]|nr:tRNA uridine-5-carboxymethylaminomethyl(34) synthesis GTPase MnmE [Candidatus Avigastranaerophilus faecigallinarum]